MTGSTEQKISQLQLLEQNLQNFNMQKQQLQSKIFEFDSALEELANTEESYKIVGNIMVKVDKSSLKKELEEGKENTTIRINALEKQEQALREKAKKIQQEVVEEMKDKKEE